MKYFLRIIGAIITAVLFGFVAAVLIGDGGGNSNLFAFFTLIGLVAFSVILWLGRSNRNIFGRFCLVFGIEWLSLPLAISIAAGRAHTFGGAIGAGLLLALSIPLGLLLGVFFLLFAYLNLRKRK